MPWNPNAHIENVPERFLIDDLALSTAVNRNGVVTQLQGEVCDAATPCRCVAAVNVYQANPGEVKAYILFARK